MRLLILTAAVAAAIAWATPAEASGTHPHTGLTAHDRQVILFFQHHPKLAATPGGGRALSHLLPMLVRELRRIRRLQAARETVPADCRGATAAACAWYLDGATQCEVDHEGGWTSVSPDGTYAGRFQSDQSFETETPFGRAMEARYGRASNWPSWAQIEHAHEVWLYSGWGRWPPYYRYGCSRFAGARYNPV